MAKENEFDGFQVLNSFVTREGNGPHVRTTFIKGEYPDLGTPHDGWEGKETIVKRVIIKPVVVFEVRKREPLS